MRCKACLILSENYNIGLTLKLGARLRNTNFYLYLTLTDRRDSWNRVKFYKPSCDCILINCIFLFCHSVVMTKVKHSLPNHIFLHYHLWRIQNTFRLNQRIMCQLTNYLPTTNRLELFWSRDIFTRNKQIPKYSMVDSTWRNDLRDVFCSLNVSMLEY